MTDTDELDRIWHDGLSTSASKSEVLTDPPTALRRGCAAGTGTARRSARQQRSHSPASSWPVGS